MDTILKKIESKPYEKMARLEDQKLRILKDQTKNGRFKMDIKFNGDSSIEEEYSPN